ncbi:MAG: preprotein translocase subunit YajC [Chlamydiae bacterium]|nr:MAG: preprotein translocase subunit YajC [Chlamydiota bacterium]
MKKLLLTISVFLLSAMPVLAEGAAAPAGGKKGGLSPLILIGGIFVIMYFLMIRPQQKKQKEKTAMLNSVEEGDKIITIGGIYGEVKQVKDNSVRVQIDDHTRVELAKSSISTITQKANAPAKVEAK